MENRGFAPVDRYFPLVLTADGNIIVFKDTNTGEIPWNEVYQLVEVLDLETPYLGVTGGYLVNCNKFGVLWSMMCHFDRCESLTSLEIYFAGYKPLEELIMA